MTKKILILSAVAAAFAATAANAADYRFQFQKHELQTAKGVENIYARVKLKAEAVCAADGKSLAMQADAARCVEDVTDDIVSKIDDASLNALHAEADGASPSSSAS